MFEKSKFRILTSLFKKYKNLYYQPKVVLKVKNIPINHNYMNRMSFERKYLSKTYTYNLQKNKEFKGNPKKTIVDKKTKVR